MNDANGIVILAIFSLQGGGAERFVLTLAEGFRKLGYQPHIICFKGIIEYPRPDIPLHFLPYQSYRLMPKSVRNKIFAKVFDTYVKRHITSKPTLVLSNLWQVDQILTFSQLPNRLFVIHNTLSKEQQINQYLTHQALNQVYSQQNIVAVSRGVAEDLKTIVSNFKSLTYIHNPIDKYSITNQSLENDNLVALKSKFSILNNGYIIHVGKFKPQKNHLGLIRAYAKSDKILALLLVGQGELQKECQQLCRSLNIDDMVIFAGFDPNPYPLIANAQGMVVASIYEGFCLVIAESLALNVPTISTDCDSGPRELLPFQNLVPINDDKALSKKLNDLMLNPDFFISTFDSQLLPECVATQYLNNIH